MCALFLSFKLFSCLVDLPSVFAQLMCHHFRTILRWLVLNCAYPLNVCFHIPPNKTSNLPAVYVYLHHVSLVRNRFLSQMKKEKQKNKKQINPPKKRSLYNNIICSPRADKILFLYSFLVSHFTFRCKQRENPLQPELIAHFLIMLCDLLA